MHIYTVSIVSTISTHGCWPAAYLRVSLEVDEVQAGGEADRPPLPLGEVLHQSQLSIVSLWTNQRPVFSITSTAVMEKNTSYPITLDRRGTASHHT